MAAILNLQNVYPYVKLDAAFKPADIVNLSLWPNLFKHTF